MSTKLHTKSYNNNRLFLTVNPNDDIPENDPVRVVDAMVEGLDLKDFKKLYRERGRCPYHPKMMLKIILYAYMNNIYSCRRIESAVQRDIHYIWLAAQERPDFVTINRFRNRVKKEVNDIFTQVVLLLAERGFITLDVEYVDGTKIESRANKYTFVWRKTVEKNRAKLQEKIRVLLGQIDEAVAQEKAAGSEAVEFTPGALTSLIDELKGALASGPDPTDREEKETRRERQKQIKELEGHRDKLDEYDGRLKQMGERNSMSKTDPDATFMRMKEDAMNNGQTKPGYNLQVSAENQFITDFALYPNPTDTLTLIPFFNSFLERYGHLPGTAVADAGYGSEENYRFMEEAGVDAFVKYNRFHLEQRPRHTPNPFHHDNFHYNADEDYYVCPMGQHMTRTGTTHSKTASGYRTESAVYRAQNCKGCPLRCLCHKGKDDRRAIEVNHRLNNYKRKARELLTSPEGVRHRGRRCVEPEAVFGQMKFNMAYRRFRHFGKDKVTMDFAFFAMAFNIKKMCSRMANKAKNGGNTPPTGLSAISHWFYRPTIEHFGEIPKKSIA